MDSKAADIPPWTHQVESGLEGIGMADTFNDAIRSSSIRELPHSCFESWNRQLGSSEG
jgi:hypothetical protein